MRKKILFFFILIFGVVLYMYFGYSNQKEKDEIEAYSCKRSDIVYSQNYYTIDFEKDLYNENELINSKVRIIQNGKVIKTFNYKKNQDYYSIDYTGLLKNDTIQKK